MNRSKYHEKAGIYDNQSLSIAIIYKTKNSINLFHFLFLLFTRDCFNPNKSQSWNKKDLYLSLEHTLFLVLRDHQSIKQCRLMKG